MSTTEWLIVVVLVGLPLGFLIGQGLINPSRGSKGPRVQVLDTRHHKGFESPNNHQAGDISRHSDTNRHSDNLSTARSLQEMSAERDRLANLLEHSEIERRRMQILADETASRLSDVEKLRIRAEEVGRQAGPRLIDSISERDRALERLQAEKAAHASTHRELDETMAHIDRLTQRRLTEPETHRTPLQDEIANIQRTLSRMEASVSPERRR